MIFFFFLKTCHIWPDMKQTSNIHCILTYLWSKLVSNLIILINLMIAARELTFGKMAFWHFTTGQIIYQVNGSKVVCCAMWICNFCLSPSKHRCILVKWNFFALRVYTKCIYNSRFNAGCSVKSPVSVNTAIGYPFQVCLLE